MGEWFETEAPSCTEEGEERRDCSRCDHYETRAIAETGHSYTSVVTDPTCTERGYITHTCHCGDSYVDTYVDALDHHMGEWFETEAPSCTEEGEERQDCSRCDHYETRATQETGHSFTNYISDGNATTEADGTKTAFCDHACGEKDTIVDEGSKITVSEITSEQFTITDQYISSIAAGTSVQDLLEKVNENAYVTIYQNGTEVASDVVLGTGMKVRLEVNGQVVQELEIVVTGDTSGDGNISIMDFVQLKSHLLNKDILDGAYGQAADTNGDGNISIMDFVNIKAHLLGKSLIQPQSAEPENSTIASSASAFTAQSSPVVCEQATTCVTYAPIYALVPEKKKLIV